MTAHRPKLDPRVLVEKAEQFYHAALRISGIDIFNNILINRDNLLSVKALKAEFTGNVKCN
ncbi:hypothetical protein CVU37_06525 [candidate division BRC1 bacterium HGW-BRC1-1]|jgi:adenine-specific DNA-methyltransferase|nr:MAG: hypothetical protein CVU37_06525 [candidate division BRC1 bacterium HGW-BRC1-1]